MIQTILAVLKVHKTLALKGKYKAMNFSTDIMTSNAVEYVRQNK